MFIEEKHLITTSKLNFRINAIERVVEQCKSITKFLGLKQIVKQVKGLSFHSRNLLSDSFWYQHM